ELKKVGDTAAVLLVSNPQHICELVDDRDIEKTLGHINYCLTKYSCETAGGSGTCPPGQEKKNKWSFDVNQETLALPENYDCYLELIDGNITEIDEFRTGCKNAPPASIENIYAVDVNVLIHGSGVNDRIVEAEGTGNLGVTGAVRKSEYLACMDQNTDWCELIGGTLKLKVWKNA
ncbi:hypothetical protein KJ660_02465, partial [Candidatus Micrarchaeota archaeon]|nr:hypothetical protein [Candidatus Micrarchaeota archaeon]